MAMPDSQRYPINLHASKNDKNVPFFLTEYLKVTRRFMRRRKIMKLRFSEKCVAPIKVSQVPGYRCELGTSLLNYGSLEITLTVPFRIFLIYTLGKSLSTSAALSILLKRII